MIVWHFNLNSDCRICCFVVKRFSYHMLLFSSLIKSASQDPCCDLTSSSQPSIPTTCAHISVLASAGDRARRQGKGQPSGLSSYEVIEVDETRKVSRQIAWIILNEFSLNPSKHPFYPSGV